MKLICLVAATAFFTVNPAPGQTPPDPDAPIQVRDYQAPIRVACVGDSITLGWGSTNNALFSYPAQLSRMLDDKWNVGNFGVPSRTLLKSGDFPYQKERALQDALKFQPNVVIIMLGTNDTKQQNWKFKDQFVGDYKDLVDKFKALDSKPRIFVCLPDPVPGTGNYGINESVIEEELPLIQNLAKTEDLGLIDMHTALSRHDDLFPDRVHPNDKGANLMARTAYKALTGVEFTGELSPRSN